MKIGFYCFCAGMAMLAASWLLSRRRNRRERRRELIEARKFWAQLERESRESEHVA